MAEPSRRRQPLRRDTLVPPPGTPVSGATPLAAIRATPGTSFVGRAAELAQLMRLLEEAAGGDARLAVIQGAAGIGKTRLAEELGARAAHAGARFGIGA